MAHKLPNYLRTHRRRAGFSQTEVAFLLGSESGSKVSRYEKRARRPTLETVLAYEALFRVPARELFAGIYQKVERTMARRAGQLVAELRRAKPGRRTDRKLEALEAMARSKSEATQDL